jgi:hypothetical protein
LINELCGIWKQISELGLDDWASLGTVGAALFSAIAAAVALWTVQDTRRARQEADRPLVILSSHLEPAGKIIFLLKNYGGLAENVRIVFPGPVENGSGRNIALDPFFAEPREFMLPGEEQTYTFTYLEPYLFRQHRTRTGGTTYEGATGRHIRFSYTIIYTDARSKMKYTDRLTLSLASFVPPSDDKRWSEGASTPSG